MSQQRRKEEEEDDEEEEDEITPSAWLGSNASPLCPCFTAFW